MSPHEKSASNTELNPYQRTGDGDSMKKPGSSARSNHFDTEAGTWAEYEKRELAPPVPALNSSNYASRDIGGGPKDEHELVSDKGEAVMGLDPRFHEAKPGQLGSSAQIDVHDAGEAPGNGIGVRREWQLDSQQRM